VAIVDHNLLPQYAWPNAGQAGQLVSQPDIAGRWAAFGWRVLEMDGHSMREIIQTVRHACEDTQERPTAIVAHTIKGKGVSFMENDFSWHTRALDDEHYAAALRELDGVAP
jgi:transketolase